MYFHVNLISNLIQSAFVDEWTIYRSVYWSKTALSYVEFEVFTAVDFDDYCPFKIWRHILWWKFTDVLDVITTRMRSCETSIILYQVTRCYITGDSIRYSFCWPSEYGLTLSAGIIRNSVGISAQSKYHLPSADRDNVHELKQVYLISRPVNSVSD